MSKGYFMRGLSGHHALSRTQVFKWHKAFLDGRESVEDEPRSGRPCTSKTDENVTKMRDLVRSDRSLTEWSVVCWIWISRVHLVRPEIADTWMLHHDNDPCHTVISVNEFLAKKRHFSGSAATILSWSESVWLLPFPKTQIPHQRSSFWNCRQHPKRSWQTSRGHFYMKTSSTATGRGATSPAVCGFPRELLWRR